MYGARQELKMGVEMRSEEDETGIVTASSCDCWLDALFLCLPLWVLTDRFNCVTNVFNLCYIKKNLRDKCFLVDSQ